MTTTLCTARQYRDLVFEIETRTREIATIASKAGDDNDLDNYQMATAAIWNECQRMLIDLESLDHALKREDDPRDVGGVMTEPVF